MQRRLLGPSMTVAIAVAAVAAMIGVTAVNALAGDDDGVVLDAGGPGAVKDSYIVVLKDKTADAPEVDAAAANLTKTYGGTTRRTYSRTVKGFSAQMSESAAKQVAGRSDVAYVEQDRKVSASDAQSQPPSWGLDRIDQTSAPLDGTYNYPTTAESVHAYVIDSGIRISHKDFGGRASYGYDFVDNDNVADDCSGHGTHVAGTLGGSSYGVAKGVQLIAVRVLDCSGSGTLSQVIAGVDWVTNNAVEPAVANLSLGTAASSALDDAVRASIASGVTYAVAAGNSNADACGSSPADVTQAITVGATDETDYRASFSNYGKCVAVFAPGTNITSAYDRSDTDSAMISGTSMAAPHVAGTAALLLAASPYLTPQQVRSRIVGSAVIDAVRNPKPGSPNRLLHVGSAPGTSAPIGLIANVNGLYVTTPDSGRSSLIASSTLVADSEQFDEINAGNGWVGLRAHSNGLYVTAEDGGNSPLIANRTAIGAWEKFKIINNSDASVSLLANANGLYVTAEYSGSSPLIANRTSIGDWEKFSKVGPPTPICLVAGVNGLYVTADNGGRSSLIANSGGLGDAQEFDQVDAGNGWVGLRSRVNGLYVTAENGGNSPLIANRTAIGAWEKFKIVDSIDGTVSLLANANGLYVTADNGGTSALIASRTAIGPAETFYRYLD